MHAAEYLIKSATTRWKELYRQGKLSTDALATLNRRELLNPDYLRAYVNRKTQRGLSWSDILHPNNVGKLHTPFVPNYLEAAQKLPPSMKPVRLLGAGGESLAVKTRDGNVLKLTLSGKPVPAPRAFDAPILNPGGVVLTQNRIPVQWHVQPKLDILSQPSQAHIPTSVSDGTGAPVRPRMTGDEIAAQRFVKRHARGDLKPTDVYPQKWTDTSRGAPIMDAAPKVQQFGRMPDGRMVLADRGAISPHGSIHESFLAGDFTGPQTFFSKRPAPADSLLSLAE